MAGFNELHKKLGNKKFNSYASDLAYEYAFSERPIPYKDFAVREGISEKCFKQLLEYAVIHNLVDDWIVDKMEKKACENQEGYSPSGKAVIDHYQKLRAQRRLFMFKLAKDFVNDEDNPIEDFLERYWLEPEELLKLLEKVRDNAKYYCISHDVKERIQYRIFFHLMPIF